MRNAWVSLFGAVQYSQVLASRWATVASALPFSKKASVNSSHSSSSSFGSSVNVSVPAIETHTCSSLTARLALVGWPVTQSASLPTTNATWPSSSMSWIVNGRDESSPVSSGVVSIAVRIPSIFSRTSARVSCSRSDMTGVVPRRGRSESCRHRLDAGRAGAEQTRAGPVWPGGGGTR